MEEALICINKKNLLFNNASLKHDSFFDMNE